MYVDVHCHLPEETFPDPLMALQTAQQHGVVRVIVNGTDHEDNMLIASWKHPCLRRAFGLHPCMEHTDTAKTIAWIRANRKQCIAIGEIGLDLHWKTENFATQLSTFKDMLALSKDLNLPVIIHSRKAEAEVLTHVKDHPTSVILHAFGGSKQLIAQAIAQKCSFSIPSNIGRTQSLQQMVSLIPLSQLLTETDAPHLGKDKGIPSQPQDVIQTVEHIAALKKITPEECQRIIFMNYQRIFKD